MDKNEIIQRLDLEPLNIEGGWFRRTYQSNIIFGNSQKNIASAIFYLITKDSFSAMHKLKSRDEIFHFYFGDPVEMLLLNKDGSGESITLSNHFGKDFNPQQLVPAGVWQGSRLKKGGKIALLGVTVAPAFEYDDFVLGNREDLVKDYPHFKNLILNLTRE